MATKICLMCESRGGMNFMKGDVTQEFDSETKAAEITEWSCPYCGYKETETVPYTGMGVAYNSGIVQGPVKGEEDRGVVQGPVL